MQKNGILLVFSVQNRKWKKEKALNFTVEKSVQAGAAEPNAQSAHTFFEPQVIDMEVLRTQFLKGSATPGKE